MLTHAEHSCAHQSPPLSLSGSLAASARLQFTDLHSASSRPLPPLFPQSSAGIAYAHHFGDFCYVFLPPFGWCLIFKSKVARSLTLRHTSLLKIEGILFYFSTEFLPRRELNELVAWHIRSRRICVVTVRNERYILTYMLCGVNRQVFSFSLE